MKTLFNFAPIILTMYGIIALGSLVIYKVFTATGVLSETWHTRLIKILMILLPIILTITMGIGSKIYSKINAFFYTASALWLGVLMYLFMAALVVALIYFSNSFFNLNLSVDLVKNISTAFFFLAIAFVIYGTINATMPRVVNYEISSGALSTLGKDWAGKKIVLISDTHLGIIRGASFMNKVVNKINAQKPDLVVIAGDIIDGPVFPYAKGLAPLSNIKSTFGTFYTPGNHEVYNTEPEKFYPVVKSLTNTLIDQKQMVNNTQIIGLSFQARESEESILKRLAQTGYDKNIPSIVLLHEPKNSEILQNAGASLVVSGHTHCGQFFPINLIVRSIYKKYSYGLNQVGSTFAITTCGIGTAMTPMRIGANPELVVIKVK